MNFGSSKRRVRTLHTLYRWLPGAALIFGVIAVGFIWWLFGYRPDERVLFTGSASGESASGQVEGKKPSPLGSGAGNRADTAREPATPPLAIPPTVDLGGGNSALVVPGNSELNSSPNGDDDGRLARLNVPWPIEGQRYQAQHKKGFGGCWGELLLRADRLLFNCADNPRKSLSFAFGEISGVDDDGVAASGEKYHFEFRALPGKRQVGELFDEWIRRSRLTQKAR